MKMESSQSDDQRDSVVRLRDYVRELKLQRGEVFVDVSESSRDVKVKDLNQKTNSASSSSLSSTSCRKTDANINSNSKTLSNTAKSFMDNSSISSSSTVSDIHDDELGVSYRKGKGRRKPPFLVESSRVSMSSDDDDEDPLPFSNSMQVIFAEQGLEDDAIYNDWDSGLSRSSIELSNRDDDDDDDDNDDNHSWNFESIAVPPDDLGTGLDFPHRALRFMECQICLEMDYLRRRVCCDFQICNKCLVMYLTGKVTDGKVQIECANDRCNALMFKEEIRHRLPLELREKFVRFLIDANKDPHVKTCPSCSSPFEIDPARLKVRKKKRKNGVEVTCTQCRMVWCFHCQAPFHSNMTCKKYRNEDEMVKRWAKEKSYGQVNAQKCPKCKIFVQKMDGCDHMKCSQCKTNFCYRCGDRYISVKFFGSHWNRFSLFGCKYRLMPEKNGLRRLIRGSHFVGRVLTAVVFAGLGVAAGAILVAGSVVILPGYGIFVLRRRMLAAKQRKRFDRVKMRMISMAEKQQAMMEKQNGNLETVVEESETETLEHSPDPQQIQVIVHQPEEEVLSLDDSHVDGDVIANKYTREDTDVTKDSGGATSTREDNHVSHSKKVSSEGRHTKLVFNVLTSMKRESEQRVEGNVDSGIICDDDEDEYSHGLGVEETGISERVCENVCGSDCDVENRKIVIENERVLTQSDLNSVQHFPDNGDSKDLVVSSEVLIQGNADENLGHHVISSDVQNIHSLSKGDVVPGEKLSVKKLLKGDNENKNVLAPLKIDGEYGGKGCFGNIFSVGKRTSNDEDAMKSNKDKLPSAGTRKAATWEKCRRRGKEEIDLIWGDKSPPAVDADNKCTTNLPLMVHRSSSSFTSITGHRLSVGDEVLKSVEDCPLHHRLFQDHLCDSLVKTKYDVGEECSRNMDSETDSLECESDQGDHVKTITFEISDLEPSKALPQEHISDHISQISAMTHL